MKRGWREVQREVGHSLGGAHTTNAAGKQISLGIGGMKTHGVFHFYLNLTEVPLLL
jgi:hypothetical protein